MPVLTRDGVVGYVQTVTGRTADVLLLVDSKSALGGVVVRTSEPVVVEGVADAEHGLRVRALVAGADLREGDEVVTSGLSQIYPPGLPVGRIHRVVPVDPGRAAEAWLTPAVDFNRLEAVAVLLAPGPPEGPEADPEPAAGDDTGERAGATAGAHAGEGGAGAGGGGGGG